MFKKIFNGKKAAFFDLDGTLVVTKDYWIEAMSRTLRQKELSWINAADFYITGKSLVEIYKTLILVNGVNKEITVKDLTEKTNSTFLEIIGKETFEATEGFWELASELKAERKFKLALVSNSHKQIVQTFIKKLEFENVFDLVLCGDEITKPKPDPQIFNKALKSLKLWARDVISFEDSPIGAKASVKAGLDTMIIWSGEFKKIDYPEQIYYFLPDFIEIPDNLDKTYFEKFGEEMLERAKAYQEKQKGNNIS